MKFNGSNLKALIQVGGYKNIEIARKVGVTGKTVGRWTRGEATPPVSTIKKIAKELGVSAEVLTSQDPIEKPKCVNLQTRSKIGENISVRTQNALLVAAERYGVPQPQIIELAPLMFTLIAEGSLDFRRRKVEEAGSNMDALDETKMGFRTLVISEALQLEEDSIKSRDIFGLEFDEVEPSNGALSWNPFDEYLRCLVDRLTGENANLPEFDDMIDRYVDHVPMFSMFKEEYKEIADGDEKIAKRLTNGTIDLGNLPNELSGKERIQWFNQEAQRAEEREGEQLRKFLQQFLK